MEISGKTALLTGATGGLGRAIAKSLAERGASLVLSSRKAEELQALAAELPGTGHRAVVADLAEFGAVDQLLAEAGEIDILVANAGLPGSGRIENLSEEQITRALRVNLEVPILMAQALLPSLERRGGGHLVFVSSLAGKTASPRSSIYNATKFGLRGFALGLRADLAGGRIGSSLVSPGFVRDAGMFADTGAKTPPGIGTARPEQVGRAVVEAIQHNRVEITVAPLQMRAMAHVGMALPGLSLRMQTGQAGQRMAESVASAQLEKR